MTRVSDHIRALTHPTTETVTVHRDNGTVEQRKVQHPALLDQLLHGTTSTTMRMGGTFNAAPGSKPAAGLDGIALWQRIDRQSALIAAAVGVTEQTVPARLSRISGASPDMDDTLERETASTARSWVVSARIITGHDTPPFAPDVPCPNTDCERRATLRIRIQDLQAVCTECGTVWGEDDIGQLGTYVRWASEHLTGPRHWVTDDTGQMTECVVCLSERQAMAERAVERARAKTHA